MLTFLIRLATLAFLVTSKRMEQPKCVVVLETYFSCIAATEADLPTNMSYPNVTKIGLTWLRRSHIPVITKQFVQSFPNLSEFEGINAGIQAIEKNAFTGLDKLTRVDLASNNITEIDPDIVANIPKFNHFSLELNTNFKLPKSQPVLNSNAMLVLVLSGCGLKEIYKETVSHLPGLRQLNLGNNSLSALPEGFLRNNREIRILYLQSNRFVYLSDNLFMRKRQRNMLMMMHDNPWDCDCKLRPFMKWVMEKNRLDREVPCGTPQNVTWHGIVRGRYPNLNGQCAET